MKQAYLVLKLPIFVLLLFVGTTTLSAQNCYQTFLQDGIQAFNSFQFETAIKKFEAAKVCDDKPGSAEADEWLTKAQNGYIDRLQLIASRFLTSEGQRAFQKKDHRSAFRLFQEALKYKSDNEQAKKLREQILFYLADYQYNIKIDPRFYHAKQVSLESNRFLVALNINETNDSTKLKLVEPDSRMVKISFDIAGSISNYQFSGDGKWLVVQFYDPQKQQVNLSLWDVESQQLIYTFEKIYSNDPYKSFAFSENSEKLVYRSAGDIERITHTITEEDSLVTDTLKDPGYSLNVYDLLSRANIYTTGVIADYYGDSPDGRFDGFRRESVRQDLINEKITTKFSTEGVITTNNTNFILKENEFRIRADRDFAISPDGKKFAFNQFAEEQKIGTNFNSEIRITVGTPPKALVGKLSVINLENGSSVFSTKSDYEALPQRFLPFAFSKNSNHLIFINNRKYHGSELFNFNEETGVLKSGTDHFLTGFNIYNFEKEQFYVENEQKIYDFFVTENNLVVTWNGVDYFVNKNGNFGVHDLKSDTLVFNKSISNEFSHYYDVKSENDLLYFSTFDPNSSETKLNVLDLNLDSIIALKYDFVPFKYTYVRTSAYQKKVAFLTDSGHSISVWNVETQKKVRELKCKDQIAEFDFSKDANFLIVRDKNNIVKVVDLKITGNLYDYFDNYLEKLSPEERKEFGIDW